MKKQTKEEVKSTLKVSAFVAAGIAGLYILPENTPTLSILAITSVTMMTLSALATLASILERRKALKEKRQSKRIKV